MKLTFNWDNFEQADDYTTDTTHWGGFVLINGVEVAITGDDRSSMKEEAIVLAVEKIMGKAFTEDDSEELFSHEEASCEVNGTFEFTLDVPHCSDCGMRNQQRGHMTCAYPQDY